MRWTLDVEHALGRQTIRRYRWPNGLRLILLADRGAPIFSYQTWFRVGSRNEQPGRTGMAHFFEHLMFNETETLGRGQLDRLIEATGGDNNAATWTDWTYYRTSLPARDLELAVRIESERMQRLVLEDEQIEAEREVVTNERLERVEDDVDGFLDEKLYELAFTVHPYRWPTIGWMDDIRNLAKPDIHAFYRTYYKPSSATIVLVGDVDERTALGLIDRYYGDIPAADLPAEPRVIEPEQQAERRQRFAKPVQADRLMVGYKAPGQGDPDWAVLEFIAALLAGGPSSRLYRRLVIDTEMATSVDCAAMPFREPSLFRLGVNLTRGHRAEAALAEIDAAVAELGRTPVPAAELSKIKNCVETDFWAALEDCDGRAEALGHYETTLGDFRRLFEMADRFARIDAGDVRRVAAQYLEPRRRTIVIAEPDPDAAGDDGDDGPDGPDDEGELP
jgi:zinc protease